MAYQNILNCDVHEACIIEVNKDHLGTTSAWPTLELGAVSGVFSQAEELGPSSSISICKATDRRL